MIDWVAKAFEVVMMIGRDSKVDPLPRWRAASKLIYHELVVERTVSRGYPAHLWLGVSEELNPSLALTRGGSTTRPANGYHRTPCLSPSTPAAESGILSEPQNQTHQSRRMDRV